MYRQRPVIYRITCAFSDSFYIGSARASLRRWRQHLHLLRTGRHHCRHLQRACNRYGIESLWFEPFEDVEASRLIEREQHWLDHYRGHLFNCALRAGSIAGLRKSANAIERSAAFHRGRKRSAETRALMSAAMRGNQNGRHTARQFCGKGHPHNDSNLYCYRLADGRMRRACNICRLENQRRQEKRRATTRKGAK